MKQGEEDQIIGTGWAEILVHWFGPIVAVIYAAGFLIVLNFLSPYGVSDIDIVEAKYVQVGTLFGIACCIFLLSFSWFAFLIKSTPKWDEGTLGRLILSERVQINKILSMRRYLRWSFVRKSPRITIGHIGKVIAEGDSIGSNEKKNIAKPHATYPTVTSTILMLCVFYYCITFAPRDFARHNTSLIAVNFLFPVLMTLTGLISDSSGRHGRVARRDAINLQRILLFLQSSAFLITLSRLENFVAMVQERLWLSFVFPCLMFFISYYGFRVVYRMRQSGADKAQQIHLFLSHGFIILVFFYLSIISFAHSVYPYIPVARGGGSYVEEEPVFITFKANSQGKVEVDEDIQIKNALHSFLIFEETSSSVYLIDIHEHENLHGNGRTGPENWRNDPIKPTVYKIEREEIASIAYLR